MSGLRVFYRTIIYLLFILISLVVLIPLFVTVLGTFRSPLDIVLRGAMALPASLNFSNLTAAFTQYDFGKFLVNTIIVTVPVVVLSIVIAILCAYALAMMEFPFKKLILVVVTVVGIMISEEFIMIPLFGLMKTLHLIDTYTSVILPQVAMSAAFATLVIRSFFVNLPRELVDAALEDGASSWQTLWIILVPIASPAIMTSLTLTATWTWNDYILPLVMLPSQGKATLPLGLALFQGQHLMSIPMTMAGVLITALPMLLVYFVFQRHIARGLVQGSTN
jgi:raffinose/stachyose/melibiose transport system permease protein